MPHPEDRAPAQFGVRQTNLIGPRSALHDKILHRSTNKLLVSFRFNSLLDEIFSLEKFGDCVYSENPVYFLLSNYSLKRRL